MTSQRSDSTHTRPTAPPTTDDTPETRLEPLGRIPSLTAAASSELSRKYPNIPPPATPEQEAAYRQRELSRLYRLSAPSTEYHISLRKEPPPPPPEGSSWLRISRTAHRLAADPPHGHSWTDWKQPDGPYRQRYCDPDLTALQIAELMSVPGNTTDNGKLLRICSRVDVLNNGDLKSWGTPDWHLPEDLEPYDFHAQSDVIEQQAPLSPEQKATYRKRDGSMDWLRFVRDKWEAKLGYPEIMAWWQYLDLRARQRAPGVSQEALATGIPKLKPTNVPKYIASVSLALQAKRISQEEANALLYGAQLLIGALKALPPPAPKKPRGRHAPKALPAETIPDAELIE